MSGTDTAGTAICLHARYAMSGTDIAYRPTAETTPSRPARRRSSLRRAIRRRARISPTKRRMRGAQVRISLHVTKHLTIPYELSVQSVPRVSCLWLRGGARPGLAYGVLSSDAPRLVLIRRICYQESGA
eukprot:2929326-Rhodomonas_salina.4